MGRYMNRFEGASPVQTAILNAIPAHLALLDAHGTIVVVNDSWKRFAQTNFLRAPDFGVGCNYLEVCERASAAAAEGRATAEGLRRGLRGEVTEFTLEYPCHSPTEQRWYRLMATSLNTAGVTGAVVMHINITERR